MPRFQPRDPDFADRVAETFRAGSAAPRWGGELLSVSLGEVEVVLPVSRLLLGSGGGIHRGCLAAMLDEACVLAALSLSSAGDEVTTIEYKLNFLASALGDRAIARAEVVRPGRSITVCRADAWVDGRLVAKMLATLAVSRPA